MTRILAVIDTVSTGANWISAGALVLMMLLTTMDVILRVFGVSVPGAFEITGLLGALVISFSLAYTSLRKGHIAVEFLLNRLPENIVRAIDTTNSFISSLIFGIISWQTFLYGLDLLASGEVSMTVQIPTYPFVMGIALGTLLLAIVLLLQGINTATGIKKQ